MRERWFGATGRRVPELMVEGDPRADGGVVLDSVADADHLRDLFAAGQPVVVRAASPEEVTAALARPEVACVVVPPGQSDLLDLDLTDLTYG